MKNALSLFEWVCINHPSVISMGKTPIFQKMIWHQIQCCKNNISQHFTAKKHRNADEKTDIMGKIQVRASHGHR